MRPESTGDASLFITAKFLFYNTLVSREGIEPPTYRLRGSQSFSIPEVLLHSFHNFTPIQGFCFRSKGRTCFLTVRYDENAILLRFCYVSGSRERGRRSLTPLCHVPLPQPLQPPNRRLISAAAPELWEHSNIVDHPIPVSHASTRSFRKLILPNTV